MDSESKLEQFVLLSKGACGPALAKLIEKVTAEAGIFSFGALLDVPSVREVCSCSKHASPKPAQCESWQQLMPQRVLVPVLTFAHTFTFNLGRRC